MPIDNVDKRILMLLQQNSRITNAALAEAVGLSPPACLKRVKRLRDTGVITREVALLDPKLAGQGITMIVEVEVERDRSDLFQQSIRRIRASREVTQCYQVTGEVDFILIVNVESMEAFQAFTERVLYADPNLRKFRTLISMNRIKFTTEVPL
ncbi:Lrp/AsnC family transcriptional regulator [Neptunomonas marina]|uniref:Lrp/AsnC family transcriptional regulator n=1 Tax=Neptunomonas marina TaxID=1815562 RepID=A0A437Q8B2_9GAMM|nr:Lrp/AsnC family transcriptional regulator [Neptunomonas marina]RVU30583.1 Lrp/AsnC family transcriptional regulator [Neptunomonas marina]